MREYTNSTCCSHFVNHSAQEASLWAHLNYIVYAADHNEAIRAGFDDTNIAIKFYGQVQPANISDSFLRSAMVKTRPAPLMPGWLMSIANLISQQ